MENSEPAVYAVGLAPVDCSYGLIWWRAPKHAFLWLEKRMDFVQASGPVGLDGQYEVSLIRCNAVKRDLTAKQTLTFNLLMRRR
jgi:hypothetical protein